MQDKVIVTDQDIYGFEELSPEFKPEIKVKFASDISAGQKREIRKMMEVIANKKGEVDEKSANEYGELIVKYIVLDWNIYDSEGNKLPVNADTIDNKLSRNLSKWILEEANARFLGQKTTAN